MSADLVAFLRARLDEDEAAAKAASPSPWSFGGVESVSGGMLYDENRTIASVTYEQPSDHDGRIVRHLLSDEANANGRHIARHDPARVLRQVEAFRAIVEQADEATALDLSVDLDRAVGLRDTTTHPYCGDVILHALAAIYSDHPEYREEWAL